MLLDIYIYIYKRGNVDRLAWDSEGGESIARQSPAAAHGAHTRHDQWPWAAFFGCSFELENWCAGYVLRQAGQPTLSSEHRPKDIPNTSPKINRTQTSRCSTFITPNIRSMFVTCHVSVELVADGPPPQLGLQSVYNWYTVDMPPRRPGRLDVD